MNGVIGRNWWNGLRFFPFTFQFHPHDVRCASVCALKLLRNRRRLRRMTWTRGGGQRHANLCGVLLSWQAIMSLDLENDGTPYSVQEFKLNCVFFCQPADYEWKALDRLSSDLQWNGNFPKIIATTLSLQFNGQQLYFHNEWRVPVRARHTLIYTINTSARFESDK